MTKVSDILVKLALDTSGLRRQIEDTKSQLEGAFGKEAIELSANTGGLLADLAVGIGKVGMASVGMAGEMKANKVAFTQFIGSAEQAESMLANLSGFAENTPFELPGLMDASKKMLSFQFAAQDIIPIMAAVGDSIAVVGGGQEAVNGVINALGQMQATGMASTETMNQLSAQGINGWGYLADSMGVSVAEAMARVQKGAVDSTTAINGVVLGMQTNFKGGMAAMSQEMPGLLDNIKSNVGTVMLEIGTRITEALDLKNKLQGAVTYLNSFASAVESAGVKSAILGLVPPEATAAVFAIGGALITVAIPAVVEFAGAVALAVAPMLGYIAVGVALGVLAYEVWQNWEPLGELFSGLWDHIVSTAAFCLNNLQTNFFNAISSIMKLLTPLANLFGGALSTAVNDWANNAAAKVKELGSEMQVIEGKRSSSLNVMGNAASKLTLGKTNLNIDSIKEKLLPNTTFTGLSGTTAAAGAVDNSAVTRSAEEYQRLEEKAKQVSKSIEQAWAQTTQTQLQQLDVWNAEQIAALGETQEVNKNYQADTERLAAVYGARRIKILQQEAAAAQNTFKSIHDGWKSIQEDTVLGSLTGSDKDIANINKKYVDKLNTFTAFTSDTITKYAEASDTEKKNILTRLKQSGIKIDNKDQSINEGQPVNEYQPMDVKDVFNKITEGYASKSEIEKQQALDALNSQRIGYQQLADGTLEIDKSMSGSRIMLAQLTSNELEKIEIQRETELKNYHNTCKDVQSDIDAAYNANSMEMLRAALTEENAIRMSNYEAQKTMMDLYQQASADATLTWAEIVARTGEAAYSSFKTGLVDIINGTKSISEAWQALGQTVKNVLATMAAEWITGQLAKMFLKKDTDPKGTGKDSQVAKDQQAAAATAAAWWPAAIARSLATAGANAGPAIAGMLAASAAGVALQGATGKATGGYISGPGTGQSDSILTWLSNGEYVIRASAVRDLGVGYLNRLNQGMLPAFAAGGLVAGPSLASVSRFRYDSAAAVVPKDVVAKAELAAGQEQRPADQYHITMQAWDGPSVDRWLEGGGGAKITKFLKRQARSFVPVGV